jgi:ABC-type multidrug transport system permease subunit
MIFSLIAYWMMSFSSTPQQFFLFFFINFICSLAGNSFGLMVGSLFSDPKVASGIMPLMILPLMLFSGFYKNTGDLPAWIGWIQYISPIKYTFIGLADNEFSGTNAPISLLNFDLDLYPALGVMIGLSVVARLISLFMLWSMKQRLQ